ncbi:MULTISPECIES: 2-hydroxychromene-2-carboxylate isomerase [Dyella]|uniref:2-hydroxychromene-2-carboxylate isomerase n=2 Tax=Dyella TaxID=231454 RepID=A0A4R0YZK8_9GAMM|nr:MULTISPECIES: 2-hydroxychromene-2-carboxylate isomerase [Dyella]TBR39624.1 2-hydroxychromene-2-carboxylate isomerase [Dyella terrae]TCI12794.1 2-hydroxychromene-2-carboxylate isomerase [Dyella soli]
MSVIWYFDFISPFAWLQWPKIKALAQTQQVTLHPILFASVLDHVGQKGPAEIPAKREFSYRFVLWRAREAGQPLRFPPQHPFNPLASLRLSIAAGNTIEAVDAIFSWIWAQGQVADTAESLQSVAAPLGIADPVAALADPLVKQQLRENTEAAIAAGVYGVPTLSIDGQLFWGGDAHDFAMAYLRDRGLFDDSEMKRITGLPIGVARKA